MSFHELGLNDHLLEALVKLKFETPTPIQQEAIPALLDGENDFIGLAQTGTGKTGAYGLPMLHRLDPKDRQPQGIIICPTRELCIQVTEDLKKFAAKLKGVQITAVYGGASIMGQTQELKKGSQIVVATPGRLCDLIRRRAVSLSKVTCAVLDEADEMLNMGFKEDIDAILHEVADHAKIWLFSATMPKEVALLASKYQSDPVEVTIGSKNLAAENIEHHYYVMQEKHRYQALRRILDATPDIFGLVFCRTRRDTQEVAERLMSHGYRAEAIHGDLSQAQRDYVMRKFRQKSIRIMVATDVAARGLDVDDITHVINYTLPDDAMVYTHRGGRTARAGKSGYSIALINPREMFRIKQLERISKIQFKIRKIFNGEAICRNQLVAYAKDVANSQTECRDIEPFLPQIYEAFGDLSKEEVINLFLSRQFDPLLNSYRNAPDIDAGGELGRPPKKFPNGRPADGRKPRRDAFRKGGYQKAYQNPVESLRFSISIGRQHNANKGAILRLVCDKAGIKSQMIGAIRIKQDYSVFDVDKKAAQRVRNSMKKVKFDGKQVTVQLT